MLDRHPVSSEVNTYIVTDETFGYMDLTFIVSAYDRDCIPLEYQF